MNLPEKKPCPCGYKGLDGKGKCHSFVLGGIGLKESGDASMDETTADAIIAAYRDAERLNFLLANPVVCATLQFQAAHKRRAWIDDQMVKPGRKKPK